MTTGHGGDLHLLVSAMAREVHTIETPATAIERIAHYARIAVAADDAGIMLVKARGRVETPAGTSDAVARAHATQGERGEGPCLDVVREGRTTAVTGDASSDPRWPRWGPSTADLGYSSVVSVRLQTADRTYGSLNCYSAQRHAFSQEDVRVMELLAPHASMTLAMAEKIDDLRAVAESRALVGQAQGVLMTVHDVDARDAFELLRGLARDRGVRLLEVCEQVVADRHELRKRID